MIMELGGEIFLAGLPLDRQNEAPEKGELSKPFPPSVELYIVMMIKRYDNSENYLGIGH